MSKDDSTSNYTDVLLEDIRDKVNGIIEAVSVVNSNVIEVKGKVEKIEVKTNLTPPIKAAVTEQTKEIKDHELRITALESI